MILYHENIMSGGQPDIYFGLLAQLINTKNTENYFDYLNFKLSNLNISKYQHNAMFYFRFSFYSIKCKMKKIKANCL